MRLYLANNRVDILSINETRLDDSIDNDMRSIFEDIISNAKIDVDLGVVSLLMPETL